MALLNSFLPYVLLGKDGCPSDVAILHLRNAAIKFCEKSRYWRVAHPPIPTVLNQRAYSLTLPAESQLATVIEPIKHGIYDVFHRTNDWLDINIYDWKTRTSSRPDYFTIDDAQVSITLDSASAEAGLVMTFKVALKPTRAATTISDILFNEWVDVIAAGANSTLFKIGGAAWFDPGLADNANKEFQEGIDEAKAKALASYKTHDKISKSKAHWF